MSLRILLADDHHVVREALRTLLESRGFVVVAEASEGQEAVRLTETLSPDLVIMDYGMPGTNGIEAAIQIQRVSPKTTLIILSVHQEAAYVMDALRVGVKGYVLKSCAASELFAAIREVSCGGVYLTPQISGAVVEAFVSRTEEDPEALTTRERHVLQLIAKGQTSKEMATELGISQKTAEAHRMRLKEKLRIHDTPGLVRYAIRRGIIQPCVYLLVAYSEEIMSLIDFYPD